MVSGIQWRILFIVRNAPVRTGFGLKVNLLKSFSFILCVCVCIDMDECIHEKNEPIHQSKNLRCRPFFSSESHTNSYIKFYSEISRYRMYSPESNAANDILYDLQTQSVLRICKWMATKKKENKCFTRTHTAHAYTF